MVKLGHELAAEMRVDETELCDELILVAGRVPSDISQALLDKCSGVSGPSSNSLRGSGCYHMGGWSRKCSGVSGPSSNSLRGSGCYHMGGWIRIPGVAHAILPVLAVACTAILCPVLDRSGESVRGYTPRR